MHDSLVLFDTHCHLDFKAFDDDRKVLLSECYANGIQNIIIPGVTRRQWPKLEGLLGQYVLDGLPELHLAFGLHPFFISKHSRSDLEELEQMFLDHRTFLLGEVGLDANVPDMPKQVELFEAQLEIAGKFDAPVILHSYRTHSQVRGALKRHDINAGVVHAFSGSYQDGTAFADLGFYIGVGGVITWPRARKTRETISRLPLSALVLETDAPDSPVVGKAKGQATPLDLITVFDALCELRKESREHIAEALLSNSRTLLLKKSN